MLAWLVIGLATLHAADTDALLARWFAAQTNLQTWSADAVQTRTIQTFSQPLISTGKVWVVLPDRFRWELGQPPVTIAVRQPDWLWLLYPKLKRAEKYPLTGNQAGPWRDALTLLEASFPRSRADLESHFSVVSMTQSNDVVRLSLSPKSGFARKFIRRVEVSFHAGDFVPRSTELEFSDGSTMRNDFSHSILNAPLSKELFEVTLPPGTKVVEPLKQ